MSESREIKRPSLCIVILGLSITSSWGNGHATTYRSLVRGLIARGHQVLFLEREQPWYAAHRDVLDDSYGRVAIYHSPGELYDRFGGELRNADLVIVGSYVPEGADVGEWVTRHAKGVGAFYDIDTPITLASLDADDRNHYITRALVPRYELYLSFSGGPLLEQLERRHEARCARPLYCSFDPELYFPEAHPQRWDLGYLGTFAADRQSGLERLLFEPARELRHASFVVAGPQYPNDIELPRNVERIAHLAPTEHRAFDCSQRFTFFA